MDCFKGLENKRFLVLGDMIVDHYRFLHPKRLSPEAPVVVFTPESEEFRPGGAGNVANNLAALGVKIVHLCAIVGEDFTLGCRTFYGDPIAASIQFSKENGKTKILRHFVVSKTKPTTIKERLATRRQQIARVDIQNIDPISSADEEALIHQVRMAASQSDVLVLSDYAHGVMTPNVVTEAMLAFSGRPIIVNTKAKDSASKYRPKYPQDVVIIANCQEAREIMSMYDFEDEDVAQFMAKAMKAGLLVLTRGAKGALCSVKTQPPIAFSALETGDEVIDVTGAGDTVTATFAAALSLGIPYETTMLLAQAAAAIVVRKLGVASASQQEIDRALWEFGNAGNLGDKAAKICAGLLGDQNG